MIPPTPIAPARRHRRGTPGPWTLTRSVTAPGFLFVVSVLISGCLSTSTRREWREDFEALRQHLSEVYANLEWIVSHRGVNPYELNQRTLAEIADASSHRRCARAIRDFVAAFDDPHFRIEEPWYSDLALFWRDVTFQAVSSHEVRTGMSPDQACRQLGMYREQMSYGVRFDKHAGFEPLGDDDNPFPAGVIHLGSGTRIGVLRIESFGWHGFLDCGLESWEEQHGPRKAENAPVNELAFFYAVCNRILARLRERVESLREGGIEALIVDITGNGGGTDWVDPAARLLTAAKLAAPRTGMIRHPSEVSGVEARLERVRRDLERDDLPAGDRRILERAAGALARLATEVKIPCDRSALWSEPDASVDCSLHVAEANYASGVLPYLPPGSLPGVTSRTDVFGPLGFDYEEGIYRGPLFVLVDRHTASASEYFAAMLRDNEAATILGEKTLGAGCGYVNGGVPITLPHCGWIVRMSNCVRYRADGTNEIEGIEPDLPLDPSARRAVPEIVEIVAERISR